MISKSHLFFIFCCSLALLQCNKNGFESDPPQKLTLIFTGYSGDFFKCPRVTKELSSGIEIDRIWSELNKLNTTIFKSHRKIDWQIRILTERKVVDLVFNGRNHVFLTDYAKYTNDSLAIGLKNLMNLDSIKLLPKIRN